MYQQCIVNNTVYILHIMLAQPKSDLSCPAKPHETQSSRSYLNRICRWLENATKPLRLDFMIDFHAVWSCETHLHLIGTRKTRTQSRKRTTHFYWILQMLGNWCPLRFFYIRDSVVFNKDQIWSLNTRHTPLPAAAPTSKPPASLSTAPAP